MALKGAKKEEELGILLVESGDVERVRQSIEW